MDLTLWLLCSHTYRNLWPAYLAPHTDGRWWHLAQRPGVCSHSRLRTRPNETGGGLVHTGCVTLCVTVCVTRCITVYVTRCVTVCVTRCVTVSRAASLFASRAASLGASRALRHCDRQAWFNLRASCAASLFA